LENVTHGKEYNEKMILLQQKLVLLENSNNTIMEENKQLKDHLRTLRMDNEQTLKNAENQSNENKQDLDQFKLKAEIKIKDLEEIIKENELSTIQFKEQEEIMKKEVSYQQTIAQGLNIEIQNLKEAIRKKEDNFIEQFNCLNELNQKLMDQHHIKDEKEQKSKEIFDKNEKLEAKITEYSKELKETQNLLNIAQEKIKEFDTIKIFESSSNNSEKYDSLMNELELKNAENQLLKENLIELNSKIGTIESSSKEYSLLQSENNSLKQHIKELVDTNSNDEKATTTKIQEIEEHYNSQIANLNFQLNLFSEALLYRSDQVL